MVPGNHENGEAEPEILQGAGGRPPQALEPIARLERLVTELRQIGFQEKLPEKALRDQARILQSILDGIGEGVVIVDEQGQPLFSNAATRPILEFGGADNRPGKWIEQCALYLPDRVTPYPPEQSPLRRTVRGESVNAADVFIRHAEAPEGVMVQVTARPLRDEAGSVRGGIAVFHRVKEDTASLDAVRESQKRYQLLFEDNPHPMWIFDRQTLTFLSVNQAAVRHYGYTREEFLTMKFRDIHPLEDIPAFLESIAEFTAGFYVTARTWKHLKKDGAVIDVEVTCHPINYNGQQAGLVLAHDITESKRAEDELREMSIGLENAVEGISRIDVQGRFVSVNEAFAGMAGYKPQELIGMEWQEIVHPDDRPKAESAYQHMVTQGKIETELKGVQKSGSVFYKHLVMVKAFNQEKQFAGFYCFMKDITERKNLESQLAQAQKLESIGQLAAGIAHEINTPIQYVGDNTRFLRDAFSDLTGLLGKYAELLRAAREGVLRPDFIGDVEALAQQVDIEYLCEEIPKAIGQSLDGLERVASIVRAMKEFSHPGPEEKSAVNLNRAIENTILVSRNEWKYVAEMETDLDPTMPPVQCLPGPINQVVLNIIVNASHAITDVVGDGSEQKGTIKISTRRDGRWVEIRISDTGTGIPEAVRPRIFDPFFTTKEVGRGTGQGLAIAHSVIVKSHGGTITFETEIGKGTTFIIRLPIDGVR